MKNLFDTMGRAGKLILLFVFFSSTLTAQTLFTCDGRGVSKEDFLKAYNKNNTGEKTTERSYREYLELYIRYKLKVRVPYELEALAYSTPAGAVSKPYRSKGGYHIFKNLGERKSLGKMRAAQILVSIPPGAPAPVREAGKQRADSLYRALQKGADFSQLA